MKIGSWIVVGVALVTAAVSSTQAGSQLQGASTNGSQMQGASSNGSNLQGGAEVLIFDARYVRSADRRLTPR